MWQAGTPIYLTMAVVEKKTRICPNGKTPATTVCEIVSWFNRSKAALSPTAHTSTALRFSFESRTRESIRPWRRRRRLGAALYAHILHRGFVCTLSISFSLLPSGSLFHHRPSMCGRRAVAPLKFQPRREVA